MKSVTLDRIEWEHLRLCFEEIWNFIETVTPGQFEDYNLAHKRRRKSHTPRSLTVLKEARYLLSNVETNNPMSEEEYEDYQNKQKADRRNAEQNRQDMLTERQGRIMMYQTNNPAPSQSNVGLLNP